MPEMILVLLVIFVVGALTIHFFEPGGIDAFIMHIAAAVMLSLWLILYSIAPWEYSSSWVLPMEDRGGVQTITIIDEGKPVIFNVNKLFEKSFKPGSWFDVKKKNMGFYVGVLPMPKYNMDGNGLYEIKFKFTKSDSAEQVKGM